jgi:hypothetical protein
MSDTTATIQSGGDSGQLIARLGAQRTKWKEAARTLVTERDAARQERDALKTEVEKLRVIADTSASNKEVIELRRQIKESAFRKVFDRVAKAKGIREDAFDAAYQLGGYKPPDGEVDEDALGSAIDEQKAKQAFLTGTAKAEEKSAEKQVKPGPASGQGQVAGAGAGFQLPPDTDARWSDPAWQWNNRAKIAEAIKERNANGVV